VAVRRSAIATAPSSRVAGRFVALGFAYREYTIVLWVRGLTIGAYLADRIPSPQRCTSRCSVFAIMPLLLVAEMSPVNWTTYVTGAE